MFSLKLFYLLSMDFYVFFEGFWLFFEFLWIRAGLLWWISFLRIPKTGAWHLLQWVRRRRLLRLSIISNLM